LPVHIFELVTKIRRATPAWVTEYGREPTTEELAEKLEVRDAQIRTAMQAMRQPLSFETPLGGDDGSVLGDTLGCAVPSPLDQATDTIRRERTALLLATLTPREASVLRMRFGFDDTGEHTLEEVGQQFDVTRERIRQIEGKALERLRLRRRAERLRSFIDP
jgi:RNA polymerase primary sigma factor